jgi:aspartyl/glutamyl-tRNA(Asn/Gln) amidotransferase C subunit
MKINKEIFKQSALSLHIELSETLLQKMCKDSETLLTSLENLLTLNIDDVKPMHYPINKSFNTLREDEAIKIYDSNNYLKNAKHRQGKYVVVK